MLSKMYETVQQGARAGHTFPRRVAAGGGLGPVQGGGRGGRQLEIVRGVLFCHIFAVFCPFLAISA